MHKFQLLISDCYKQKFVQYIYKVNAKVNPTFSVRKSLFDSSKLSKSDKLWLNDEVIFQL